MNDVILTTKHELADMILIQVRKALAEIRPAKAEKPESETPIDINGAIRATGYAKASIYSMFSRRTIPGYKRGGKLLFLESELLQWVKSGKRATVDEIEANALKTLEK